MQNLGTLPGEVSSVGTGINNAGQVVGYSGNAGTYDHAFLWTPGKGMKHLGTLPGCTRSLATGINDAGQVVGWAEDAHGHAFLWTAAGGMKALGTLPGFPSSEAKGINDAGQVVGFACTAQGDAHAFLWTVAGGVQDLGTLGGDNSAAYGINAAGQVVGQAQTADGSDRAFLWTAAGGMKDLGTLPGGFGSKALGVNVAGQVVGDSSDAQGHDHAFLWTVAGGMQDLGTLPGGPFSEAWGVNAAGQVVGRSSGNRDENLLVAAAHAFLWTADGGMQALGTLPGATFSSANGVNAAGQVVGSATNAHGNHRAFLWTPTALATQATPTVDPAVAAAAGTVVKLATAKGDVVIELFDQDAPDHRRELPAARTVGLLQRPDLPSRRAGVRDPGRRSQGRRHRRAELPAPG
jgi:probable HAF family extracellular repeat protein